MYTVLLQPWELIFLLSIDMLDISFWKFPYDFFVRFCLVCSERIKFVKREIFHKKASLVNMFV